MKASVLPAAIVTALCFAAEPAVAAGPQDQAAAVALFQEARKLATAGDYAQACPKFAEAQRLFPTTGTLLSLGDCYEKAGKLASAWGAFKDAEITSRNQGDAEREREGQRRAEALAPRLAKLAIVVPPAVRVSGFTLKRDGDVVGEAAWGTALPVDVGQHTIEANAPGYQPFSTVVRIESNGAAASIEVPPLQRVPTDGPRAEAPPPGFWTGQRIAGVVVGSTGLVSLGVAAGFAAHAASKNSESKQNCSPMDMNFCNDLGVSLRNDAKSAAAISTATTIVGAAAIVGGVVLFATGSASKPQRAARLEVTGRIGGLDFRGRF
jgi:serine/threonine-protein kinase